MNDTFWFLIVIGFLISLNSKVDECLKESKNKDEDYVDKNKKRAFKKVEIEKLIGKKVIINLDQEYIFEEYLFSPPSKTIGTIKEVSKTWLIFEYEMRKETITRYFRLADIVSVDEVKEM